MPDITPEEIRERLSEIDYAIFAKLPDQGATLGYHPLIKSSRQLLAELNKEQEQLAPGAPPLKMGFLSGRLRALKIFGYVHSVAGNLGSKNTDGWQRTSLAMSLLNVRKPKEEQS